MKNFPVGIVLFMVLCMVWAAYVDVLDDKNLYMVFGGYIASMAAWIIGYVTGRYDDRG